MASHSLARLPPPVSSTSPISTPPKLEKIRFPSLWLLPRPTTTTTTTTSSQRHDSNGEPTTTDRRTVALLGLAGALSSLVLGEAHNDAIAAGRRPPPSEPKDKKDPSVSGVLAKVLASKKRKEAMKQAVAALKEKGKKIVVEEGP